MAPKDPDLSVYAAFVAAIGTMFGPTLAQYVAAYVLIMLGWFAGVLWGVWKREPEARMPVWAYVIATMLASVGVTATAAGYLSSVVPEVPVTALLFPVAAMIPAFPEKWADFGSWVLDRINALRGAKQ